MKKYNISITLTILGPFLTSATASATYGVNKVFYRDGIGSVVIPSSHVKGKVRSALEEISRTTGGNISMDFIDTWFGVPHDDGSYAPRRGLLHFSKFRWEENRSVYNSVMRTRTRTSIHPATGTASESTLRRIEDLFASGIPTVWKGNISYYAQDEAEASLVQQTLKVGFVWLTNMGAEKGVGFGRLQKVHMSAPKPIDTAVTNSTAVPNDDGPIHLRIRPVERIMIGGVRKPGTNFVRTEHVIPGSVIKGALATHLNIAHGVQPSHTPLSVEIAPRLPGFELLAAHFDAIRITHAFPAHVGKPRPVKMPLSTVKGSNSEFYDRARISDPSLLIQGMAPTYFVDWKVPQDFIGGAYPKEMFVTRTEINDITRRSQNENLFTYSFCLPTDKDNKAIEWICNVYFDAIQDDDTRQKVRDQFWRAVALYLNRMGKLNHEVHIDIETGSAQSVEESRDNITDELIVVLQTDAIMLNPDDVRTMKMDDDLFELYAEYWSQMCTSQKTGVPLELVNFFAHQKFQGGYLYHRYLGASEREQHPNKYYPYYLTGAGSVFRFRVLNGDGAQRCADRWQKHGLTLPSWAVHKYSQYERALWQNCPFVPENGYGEVAINLSWHWERVPTK